MCVCVLWSLCAGICGTSFAHYTRHIRSEVVVLHALSTLSCAYFRTLLQAAVVARLARYCYGYWLATGSILSSNSSSSSAGAALPLLTLAVEVAAAAVAAAVALAEY